MSKAFRVGVEDEDRRGGFGQLLEFSTTIRGRIFTAFVGMSLITALLGAWASYGVFNSGRLVIRTFDQSLMSINYARAAAADFASMREAFARRWIENDVAMRAKLDSSIEELNGTLDDDLTVAAERSQSVRAKQAITKIRQAVSGWNRQRLDLQAKDDSGADWSAIESFSSDVEREIDLLVNYAAGDGFLYREHAQASVINDLRFNMAGTILALGLSGLIAWLLARRIIRPVAIASAVADRIAHGRLDGPIPFMGSDEVGALLAAMATMRDNIRAMMDREVAMRRSAQARLADALESSHDGIIVVGADHRVALANAQAADFLGTSGESLAPGTPLASLGQAPGAAGRAVIEAIQRDGGPQELHLADGRWLRISHSATRDGGFIALCSEITVQKEQEEKVRATNLRLDAALANMSQGLCLYGADRRLRVVNRRFGEMFSLAPGTVVAGMTFAEVVRRLHAAGHYMARSPDDVIGEEMRLVDQGERGMRMMQIAGNRIIGIAQGPLSDGGWLATFEDVTERRHAEDQIAFMAKHDALTGLPNRAVFADQVAQAIARAGRGFGCAVLFLDLDHFKPVNETLGHTIGDQLLCAVADRLRHCVREGDSVARLGGDEFAIVQCGTENPEQAVGLANRIIGSLGATFAIEGQTVSVGVSIGVSMMPDDGHDAAKLMKNADVALYRAKEEGRGTWRFFEAAMDSRLQARREIELDLRKALDEDQFELHYQPIFDLRSDRITGFEALLRWRHPKRSLISPAEFVPLAEEIGIIREIGAWVLRTACAEAAQWPHDLKVAVNVSPVQLKGADLFGHVSDALNLSGLAAERLELEITESVMITNGGVAVAMLNKLRAIGVQLSMDDFGTGYSSLMSLRTYPFNKIKIDRTFVQDLASNPDAELVIRAVIVLGGGLGMRITAEGVETTEQLARLRTEGCDEVQGYLISAPVPPARLPAMLERWNSGARRGLISAVA